MKKKSILVFLTLLIGVVILAFAINNVSTPKIENENDDNSSKVELVANSSELIKAINNAPSDYETTTTIELSSDTDISDTIYISSGQSIVLKSETAPFEIGKTNLGYELTVSELGKIILEPQSSLSFDLNVDLKGEIKAETTNLNSSFYSSLVINDSMNIRENAILDTTFIGNTTVNGSLNLIGGNIVGIDSTLFVINNDAALLHTSGNISRVINGDGLYIYSNTESEKVTLGKKTEAVKTTTFPTSSGYYILDSSNDITLTSDVVINGNVYIVPLHDTIINILEPDE